MRFGLWALAVAAGLSVAASASADVPFAEGMVTITLDDGWASQFTDARDMLNQRGINSTFYIITDNIAQNFVGFMNLQQVRTLATDGHEIGSHTVSHPDLTTVSDAELTRQLSESQSYLLANAGVTSVPDFASPFGLYDQRVLDVVKQFYSSHRTVNLEQNFRDSDRYQLGAFDTFDGVPVSQVDAWIDRAVAERSWLILIFHEFTSDTPTRPTQIRTSDFTAILDHLQSVKTVTVEEGVALMQAPPPPPADGVLTIYDDILESGFQDFSWAPHDLSQTAVVHSGSSAISFEPQAWEGLYFHHPTSIDTAAFSGLDLWVNGGTSGGQAANVRFFLGDTELGSALLSDLLGAPVDTGVWQHVFMPFDALGISGSFDDLYIQDWSGETQGTLYVDDIQLVPR